MAFYFGNCSYMAALERKPPSVRHSGHLAMCDWTFDIGFGFLGFMKAFQNGKYTTNNKTEEKLDMCFLGNEINPKAPRGRKMHFRVAAVVEGEGILSVFSYTSVDGTEGKGPSFVEWPRVSEQFLLAILRILSMSTFGIFSFASVSTYARVFCRIKVLLVTPHTWLTDRCQTTKKN